MFNYRFSQPLNGIFVHHYGEFVGAEHWQSVFSIVSDKETPRAIDFIWFDITAVDSVSLVDTDNAFRHVAWKKLQHMLESRSLDGMKIVRIADKDSPVYQSFLKRSDLAGKRRGNKWKVPQPSRKELTIAEFTTAAAGLEYLGFDPRFIDETRPQK